MNRNQIPMAVTTMNSRSITEMSTPFSQNSKYADSVLLDKG